MVDLACRAHLRSAKQTLMTSTLEQGGSQANGKEHPRDAPP
jgi:hypothetical protein